MSRWSLLLAPTALAVSAAWGRHHYRDWGAHDDEKQARLPGDELIEEPASSSTMGVTVHARPEEVWRWLVQIGQDRGGMYSYERLENLFGLGIHNTEEIREEWQQLGVGDRVVLVPRGWGPFPQGYSLPVALVDPGRALVLRQSPPEHPWDAVWSFHLVPDGACRTRLLSRGREHLAPGAAGLGQRAMDEVMRPVTALMTRRMLLGIRERAERTAHPVVAVA